MANDYGLSSLLGRPQQVVLPDFALMLQDAQDYYAGGIRNKLLDIRLKDAVNQGAITEGQAEATRNAYLNGLMSSGAPGSGPANGLAAPGANNPPGGPMPGASPMPVNALAASMGGAGRTMTPWTGSREDYMDVGRASGAQGMQAQSQQRIDNMADMVHKLGPQGIAAIKPLLERMDTLWKSIDASKLTVRNGVIHYPGYDVIQRPDGHYHLEKAAGPQSDTGRRTADGAALVKQYGERISGSPN